jgi:hypothetical protein
MLTWPVTETDPEAFKIVCEESDAVTGRVAKTLTILPASVTTGVVVAIVTSAYLVIVAEVARLAVSEIAEAIRAVTEPTGVIVAVVGKEASALAAKVVSASSVAVVGIKTKPA